MAKITKGLKDAVATSKAETPEAGGESMVQSVTGAENLQPVDAYVAEIYTRKCVSTLADNIARCTVRVATKDGDEIEDGEVVAWAKTFITNKVKALHMTWMQLNGEIFVWTPTPEIYETLDPNYTQPDPMNARHISHVKKWLYTDGLGIGLAKGVIEFPVESVSFVSSVNPKNPLRGLSVMDSGGSMAATQHYYYNMFNMSQMANGSHGDILLNFPAGTSKKIAKECCDQWANRYSIRHGRAFKVGYTIGKEVGISEIGMNNREMQFREGKSATIQDIINLHGTPPILAGLYGLTRFDSAVEEISAYYDNKILPSIEMLSEFYTDQANRHFTTKGTKSKPKLSSLSKKIFEKAINETKGAFVVYLDPDSLPLAAQLREHQLDACDKYRKTQGVSFSCAAEWAGVDREENELDDIIMMDSNQKVVSVTPEPEMPTPEVEPTPKPTEPEPMEADELIPEKVRQYRNLVIECLAQKKEFPKETALQIAGDNKLFIKQVHKDFLALEDMADMADIKKYMNGVASKSNTKRIAHG